jgi:valyl-tRNA synthetase
MVNAIEFFIPISENIDIEEETKNLKDELAYLEGFLVSIEKKLSNDKFVNSAPKQVVELEKKKLSDAVQKIELIKSQIKKYE